MNTETIKPEHFNPNVVNSGGVCAHSDSSAKNNYMIFSVGNTIEKDNAFKEYAKAEGIGYKQLTGCYMGVEETAFIINSKHRFSVYNFVKDEESVLSLGPLVAGAREAILIYMEFGKPEKHLGMFRQCSKEYAKKQPAWTYDPTTDTYFVAGGY